MPAKTPLSADQIRQIQALYARKELSLGQIGALFDRSPTTIREVVRGMTYRHLTCPGYHGRQCRCTRCVRDVRREENIDRARAAVATAVCMTCGADTVCKVAAILAHPAQVMCTHCDRRRRPMPEKGDTAGAPKP